MWGGTVIGIDAIRWERANQTNKRHFEICAFFFSLFMYYFGGLPGSSLPLLPAH